MQVTRGWEGTAGGWQLELLKCQHSGCPEQSQAQGGAPFHFSHLPGPAARGHSPAACRLEPGPHRGRGVFSTWFKATISATETACGLGTRATTVADTLAHDTALAGGSQPLGQGQSLREHGTSSLTSPTCAITTSRRTLSRDTGHTPPTMALARDCSANRSHLLAMPALPAQSRSPLNTR